MQSNRFILYKNKKIHYRVLGIGQTVMLVHGFGEDGNIWNGIVDDLEGYQWIIPDIPGSGQSEMLDGENISIEDYADVIKAIIDIEVSKVLSLGEDLGEVCLIGHSMGGYITLAFAEKYPTLLSGFGLFHSSAYADDEEKKQTRRKAIDFIRSHGAYAFLKTSFPNLFAGKQHLEEMEQLIEAGRQFSNEALIQYYNAMINRPDRTHVLTNFRKPVLFIMGEMDKAVPLQASLSQCYLPAMSQVHILAAAHMGMIEERKRSATAIESYLVNI